MKLSNLPVLACLGITFAADATTVSLPTPEPSPYADTESASTIPLSGWDDLTRFFTLSISSTVSPSNALQVALGVDRNADGDLAPEETELVCGCECEEWFVRDERTASTEDTPGTSAVGPVVSAHDPDTAPTTQSAVFNLRSVFNFNWNAAKVTRRGCGDFSATLTAEFKNNPLRIVLR